MQRTIPLMNLRWSPVYYHSINKILAAMSLSGLTNDWSGFQYGDYQSVLVSCECDLPLKLAFQCIKSIYAKIFFFGSLPSAFRDDAFIAFHKI